MEKGEVWFVEFPLEEDIERIEASYKDFIENRFED